MIEPTDWRERWDENGRELLTAERFEELGLPEEEDEWLDQHFELAVRAALLDLADEQPGRRTRDIRCVRSPGSRVVNCRHALAPHGTEFNWGAGGAGAEELAANVLAEFGLAPSEVSPLYEAFADEVIAELEGDEVRLTLANTVEWLEEQDNFSGFGPVDWPLEMEPGAYLQRHPEGKHAATARAALWRGVAGGEEKDESENAESDTE